MARKSGQKAKKKRVAPTRPFEIGFLNATNTNDWKTYIDAFKLGLGTLDYNLAVFPSGGAKGNATTIRAAAKWLASPELGVDIIVTSGTGPAVACKEETALQAVKKPFVYVAVGDPGLSRLIPQTGDNFIGGTNQQVSAATQRVDFMLRRIGANDKIAVIGNYGIDPPIKQAMDTAHTYLIAQRRDALKQPISPGDNVRDIVDRLAAAPNNVKALYVCSDVYLTSEQATALNAAANANRMTTMYEIKELCTGHGRGDFALGVDYEEMCQKAAGLVKDILLLNAKPENLSVYTTALVGFPSGPPGPAIKKPAKPPKKK